MGGKDGHSLAEKLSERERVELVALAVKQTGIRCRVLATGEAVTLRPGSGIRSEAEAHILTVKPSKAWIYGNTVYLSGRVLDMRLDVPALGLAPPKLLDEDVWDPKDEYRGEEGEPTNGSFKPIFDAGPRPSFEMEQILPGFDPDDFDSDPISNAADLYEAGDIDGSTRVLHDCLEQDLRVLDAHAHLGNWAFRRGAPLDVDHAQKNYEAGVAIGELSLGPNFCGVLRWGQIDNRPFLRCLHGLGLCHWVSGDFKGAHKIFERMLWLNPGDNQGARFCLASVAAGENYEDFAQEEAG